ncbi:MAG: BspA family leucine-rich repeat surface protein [bacterium]|nr:BspA family leucine-rich repeat surface protein [bacterium]
MLLVLGLLLIVSGSYAFYKSDYISGTENRITKDNTSLELLESNSNVINIPNAIPMSDEEGKTQSNVFDFVVSSKTSKNENISYSIVLEKLQTDENVQELNDKEVKVYLTDFDGNELLLKNVSDINKDYVLYTKTNNHNSTNTEVKDKYKLRVWIDEKNTDIDFTKENNIAYSFKLGVKTNVSESDTEQTYVVKYNSNGGTGTMNSTTFKQGESKKLSKNIFTKDGYVFKGWSTSSNSKEVVYIDEQEVKNLTNVYNGTVNLYAVWTKENVTYQVRYNANGGIISPLELTSETYHWIYEDGVYKSGNKGISESDSTIKSKEFTLTETSTISFDWADSSGESGLTYSIYKNGSSEPLDEGYFSRERDVLVESDLDYKTVTIELEAGTYVLEFTYFIGSSWGEQALETGYVKNISIPGLGGTFENSIHKTEVKSKLSKNKYERIGYTFEGWSTTPTEGVKYIDEEEILNLAFEENAIVDLYAVWEEQKYEVNVVVQNGIINGESIKNVKHNGKGIFNVVPNEGNNVGIVTCTNDQKGSYLDSKIVIDNVTSNTTCTVNVTNEMTTLYKDGTLIINEQGKDRSSNIATHGKITNEYEAMSSSNSYVFSNSVSPPWNSVSNQVKSVEIGKVIQPTSTADWFDGFYYMEKGDFASLDTSQVINMSCMFRGAGSGATTFNLVGLNNWDTSSVTNMSEMFDETGLRVTTWDIGGLSKWDTSKVTDMSNMFNWAGSNVTTFNLDLSNWNTSSVTDMSNMFYMTGYNVTSFSLTGLENWDTSNVTNMSKMFWDAGFSATTFNLDLSGWNTSNVTNMSSMFCDAGYKATTWNIGDLSGWDTSKVTNMSRMFDGAGLNVTTFNLDLSNWDTSSVTNMSRMFDGAGFSATTFNLIGLNNWNVSKVVNMDSMFSGAGKNATTFNLDLSGWDTSKVTIMMDMFEWAGENATTFNLDLSNWDTSKVTTMMDMFDDAGKNATSWSVKIPSTTGSLTNTTSRWYGKTESVYIEPDSGKYFTLS